MKFRVYQNLTQFACDVEAESETEAIEKAKKGNNNWSEYEPNEDNITYEVVCDEADEGERLLAEKDLEEELHEEQEDFIENIIQELFKKVVDKFDLKSGDVSPEDNYKIEEFDKFIHKFINNNS